MAVYLISSTACARARIVTEQNLQSATRILGAQAQPLHWCSGIPSNTKADAQEMRSGTMTKAAGA
jgi:hypothetical protein